MNSPKLFWLYCLSASIYFLQGIESLPGSAFFFYLKETLKYSESQIMFLSALIPLAWLVKPFLGFFIDNLKFSKKFWIMLACIGSILGAIAINCVSLLPIIIGIMIFLNFQAAIRDISNDGQMTVVGKKFKVTGKIQSIQWIAVTTASILVGIGGGYIAEHWTYQLAYLLLLPFYGILLWSLNKYKEQAERRPKISFVKTCKSLFTDSNLLFVSLFIFLYKFAPAFGTPLSFIMRDNFHWSKLWMGTLDSISAIFSIIGAFLYYKFSDKINLKKCLTWSVYIGAITTAMYLYFTPVTAVVYSIINSTIGMFVLLMLLDLMARNTKRGLETTSFPLLCSVSNLAGTADNVTGGFLFPIFGLSGLIILSSLTSFLCLPLIKKLKV